MKRACLLIVYAICLAAIPARSQTDSISLFFETGITALDPGHIHLLDSLLYTGSLGSRSELQITGYADEPGSRALNHSIAVRRADAVKNYLLSSGLDPARIVRCSGAGNRVQTGSDRMQRRVDIVRGRGEAPSMLASEVPVRAFDVAADAPGAEAKARRRSLKDLGSMKANELLVIDNLMFRLSTAQVVPASIPVLDELVQVMKDFPGLKIRVEGHICCASKSKDTNKLAIGYSLSLQRAQAVRDYLLLRGIEYTRVFFAGFGFSRPKAFPELTTRDMDLNRRVEVRVISNK